MLVLAVLKGQHRPQQRRAVNLALLVNTKKMILPHITVAKVVQKVGIKVQTDKDLVNFAQKVKNKHMRAKRRVLHVLRVGTKI